MAGQTPATMADRMVAIEQSDDGAVGALEARYRERSLWLSGIEEPLTPRPSLPGDVDCDVAIVGAGFTGLWTAYYLKQHAPALERRRRRARDRRLRAVWPQRRLGDVGDRGHRAGVWRPPGERRDGHGRARETQTAVDEVGRVVEAEGIDCGYRKAGGVTVATTEPQRVAGCSA